jgi:hypothetical protein
MFGVSSTAFDSKDETKPTKRSNFVGKPNKCLFLNGCLLADFLKNPQSVQYDGTRKKILLVGGDTALIPSLVHSFRTGSFPKEAPTNTAHVDNSAALTDHQGVNVDINYTIWALIEDGKDHHLQDYAYTGTDVLVIIVNVNNQEEINQITSKHETRRMQYCPLSKKIIVGVNYQSLTSINSFHVVQGLKNFYDDNNTSQPIENLLKICKQIRSLCYYDLNFKIDAKNDVNDMFQSVLKVAFSSIFKTNFLGEHVVQQYEFFTGQSIQIQVRECRGLLSADRNGLSDPYVVVVVSACY